MSKIMSSSLECYKTSRCGIKSRGSAALASVYIRPAQTSAFSKTRYVWPTALDNDSRYMTRRVWGKEISNV